MRTRQMKEARVRSIGVAMQQVRPALPMFAILSSIGWVVVVGGCGCVVATDSNRRSNGRASKQAAVSKQTHGSVA